MAAISEGIVVDVTANIRDFERNMDRAKSRAQKLGSQFKRVGGRLTRGLTLPLAAAGGVSVKAFADFDAAMTQSLAIMGDVSTAMRTQMVDAAKEVARTTTTSASDAAESFFFLASAGLDASQSVAALPQVARFAQAGMFDMARATDLATDAQSALGLTLEDAQENLKNLTRVTNVLVKANTLANASVEQFSTALTTEAGAAMKTFQVDVEEGVAVLAAFADQGIKGERAGSGFSRVLRLMSQAAVQNQEDMQRLGLEFFDAQGNMRNMADIVEDLTNVLGTMSDEQRAAALESIGFSARVQGIIQPLLGTSDAIREYEAGLRQAGGTTQQVAEKQMQALSSQLKVARNNMTLAAITLGEALAPTVLKISEFVSRAAEAFASMSPRMRTTIVVVGALAAALGPVLLILGNLIAIAPAVAAGIGVIGTAIAAIGTVATGPIGLLIAAIAAVVVAWRNWDKIKEIVSDVFGAVKRWLVDRFARIVDGIKEKIDAVVGFFGDLKDKVVGNSIIPDMIDAVESEIGRLEDVLVRPVESATSAVRNLVRRMVDFVVKQIGQLLDIDLSGVFGLTQGRGRGKGGIGGAGIGGTLGAIAGSIIPGIGTGVGAAIGGFIGGLFQQGGIVPGQGPVPAVVHGGEVVLNRRAVQALGGPRQADRLNRRSEPQQKVMNFHGDINIYGVTDVEDLKRKLPEALRDLERKRRIKAR